MNNAFGILFILTGVFAIAGGGYTWGKGEIFAQEELITVLIPWADIIFTGPVSLLSGYLILKRKRLGRILGLATSGIYIFGSLLVFITMFWNHDYAVMLIVRSVSGLCIGVGYLVWTIREGAAT